MCNSIDLSDCYIFDIYGTGRVKLDGLYDQKKLINTVINNWVPLVDCVKKCSKSDYCKFVQPDPNIPGRSLEITCGVVSKALTVFINNTFHVLLLATPGQRQTYLDGAYYFQKFIFSAETAIGHYMNKDFMFFEGKYALLAYKQIQSLREHLENMASSLKSIPDFNIQKGVLFVEGQTEYAFLNKLRESNLVWFTDLKVVPYEGSGNISLKRIEVLFKDYKRRGYKIFVQGDADGSKKYKFEALSSKNLIDNENIFVFKFDFESSIPTSMLLEAIKRMGHTIEANCETTVDLKNINSTESVVKSIKEIYSFDLEPLKTEFAKTVAEILNNSFDYWHDESFMNSELGKFVKFVQQIM